MTKLISSLFASLILAGSGFAADFSLQPVADAPSSETMNLPLKSDGKQQVLVHTERALQNEHIASATSDGKKVVLYLTPEGRNRFKRLTRERANRTKPGQVAVVINRQVLSTETIKSEIDSDRIEILGAMTAEEATAIAADLNKK